MGKDQDAANNEKCTERGSTLSHDARGIAQIMPESSLIDNGKSRMLEWLRISSFVKRRSYFEKGTERLIINEIRFTRDDRHFTTLRRFKSWT